MANKFGKFLLFTAAVGTAAAAAYYYLNKKDADSSYLMDDDDDYDDFSDDCDEPVSTSRNYVALNIDGLDASPASVQEDETNFTPLSEQLTGQEEAPADETVENVEEFFDEEDPSEDEPPIQDN